MDNPLVSIITSAYNVEMYIEQCIESVLNQTMTNFEWIILDNGCTDNTKIILKDYAKKDSRIVLLENKINNRIDNGIDVKILSYIDLVHEAKGKYITDLDSDDYIRHDYLDKMYTVAIKHQADLVACGTTMFFDGNPEQIGLRIPPLLITQDICDLLNDLERYYGTFRPTWGKLFEKNFYLTNIKYFFDRPSYMNHAGGDTLTCLRALRKVKSIVCLDEALHYYRIRQTSEYHSHLVVDRNKCYDLIYNESYLLLKEMETLSDTNHLFIIGVHYHSMLDCIKLVCNSINSSYQDRLIFLQNIVTSDVFMSYYNILDDKSKKYIKKEIYNAVETIEHDYDNTSRLDMYKYFIYRYFKANQMKVSSNNNDSSLLFFSSIFDSSNKFKFGKEDINLYFYNIIPKWFSNLIMESSININILLEDVNLFTAIVNNDIENVIRICNQLIINSNKKELRILSDLVQNIDIKRDNNLISMTKDTIKDAIENQNIELAFNSLLNIYNDIILDKDILYFRAYLSQLIGDKDVAVYLITSALVLYDKDNLLLDFMNMILN